MKANYGREMGEKWARCGRDVGGMWAHRLAWDRAEERAPLAQAEVGVDGERMLVRLGALWTQRLEQVGQVAEDGRGRGRQAG